MRRKYTRNEYLDLIARIRQASPDVTLSTDVIVGFPGETDDDFERSLDVLEKVRFGQVFGFKFSPRPGTPAASYVDSVSPEVKKNRIQRLFAVADRISLDLNQELVGQDVRVLIDSPSRKNSSDWQGRGDDNRVVNFPATRDTRIGDIVFVRVLDAGPHSLVGEYRGTVLPASLPIVSV
jgi:tRNA-2-methylthio-N6-dimethylallyladenosine synthase